MGGSSPGLVEYDHIFFIAPKCSSDLGGGAAQELILCKTGGGLPQSCFQNHYIFAGGKIILLGGKFILAGLVTTQQSHPVRERKFLIPKKNQKRNLIHRFTNTEPQSNFIVPLNLNADWSSPDDPAKPKP